MPYGGFLLFLPRSSFNLIFSPITHVLVKAAFRAHDSDLFLLIDLFQTMRVFCHKKNLRRIPPDMDCMALLTPPGQPALAQGIQLQARGTA